ncbi:MAG: DrmB family protein [Polyangiaceae bacterium]|nr:DrmB family protein [Polyangiaceae bacterium]
MARERKKLDGRPVSKPEGQIRQSQLVTTFGPGAMVDLVDRSVIIGGLEHWSYGKAGYVSLDDARLKKALQSKLSQLDEALVLAKEGYFRMPPEGDGRDPSPGVGVRALEFPRWFVCRGCRRLAHAQEAFENKNGRYRHDCGKNRWSSAVPVRFVVACKRGHISDFPWISFAHLDREEGRCDRPELYLIERSLGDIATIFVECRSCDRRVPMSRATVLPYSCSGDRPWLGGRAMNEPCDQKSEMLVRTASHAYFAQVVSALRLPDPLPDPLRLRLRDKEIWKAVHKVTAAPQIEMLMEMLDHVKSAIHEFPVEKVVAAIEAERRSSDEVADRPLRSAEYERLTSAPIEQPGVVPDAGAHFAAYRVPPGRLDLPAGVKGLVVVPALREIRVQMSFSRFDSVSPNFQGEFDPGTSGIKPAVLTLPSGNEKWLPAAEIRGEGIFIELDLAAVQEWETSDPVKARAEQLEKAHEAEGQGEFPGVRFYLLHSLAHLLLTAVSLECGYAASSIRERIYCGRSEENGPDMAAIMLTTGTTGSEGTLGGLVEEGRRLRHHLREAWELGRLCSNDPVCAAHDPNSESSDRRTEGAACHGCLYIAECSCERFNRFLDRALVVPTIGNDPALAFFRESP